MVWSTGSYPTSSSIPSTGSNRITATDANARIASWVADYQTWIVQQLATANGMFRAFAIPTNGFEVIQSQVTLGLKTSTPVKIADAIVINKNATTTYFDDMSVAVPPYSPSITQASFHLLQLV